MAQKIDINTAGIEELALLEGIGEKLAARIIDYRQTVHPFEEVIELAAVPGISERIVREIADQLTLNAQPAPQEIGAEAPATEPEMAPSVAPEAMEALEEEPEVATRRAEPPEQTTLLPVPLPADEEAESPTETARARPGASAWLNHLLSALGGAILALLGLLLLNGTLEFTGANRVADLQRQVDQQRLQQSRLSNELQTLGDRLATANAAQAGLSDRARALDSDFQTLQTEVQDAVDALQTDTEQLSLRVQGVAEAAENFDAFLDGMRDILISLQGLPPTETPTPTATSTRATPAPSGGDARETPSPTAAGATRTPRPTSTPIVRTTPGATP